MVDKRTTIEKYESEERLIQDENIPEERKKYARIRLIKYKRIIQEFGEE